MSRGVYEGIKWGSEIPTIGFGGSGFPGISAKLFFAPEGLWKE